MSNVSNLMFGHMYTSLVTQTVKNLPAMQESQVQSLCWEDPLEEEIVTHYSILAWEIHGQRSLGGYSPWGHKELNMTEQLTLLLSKGRCFVLERQCGSKIILLLAK